MKYIYTNVTNSVQNVLLATKHQDIVGTRTFMPGASLELDYPGLNLYVPNLLSCITIDTEFVEPIINSPEPVVIVEPVSVEADSITIVVPEALITFDEVKVEEFTLILDKDTTDLKEFLEPVIIPPVIETIVPPVTAPKVAAPKAPKVKPTAKKPKK